MTSPFAANFTPDDAAVLAGQLWVLADPARLRIIHLLAVRGAMANRDLEGPIGLTQPTISHHVRILREAGLIVSTQDGHCILRELDRAALRKLALAIDPAVRR
ncbi:ArsR/SmtB family transcription factor [Actinoplanes teichomyceticus]|uniref:ArsR family transcriptional regulator n=1 Tax=Actinoplanes teichomyceticus TaxID=1867 RepID=A0A561WAW9_ACTTI|nr:metalloregulator ArsR/SmtB family transcription factor [Actinoplanes teichomyceticus]TWG21001.1 ArsR family transcriptional regulator [Actinoplanes teichomyceticus]GIF14822.1 transcriptional regulator [Actinoplanes teichomyceticus]